MGIRLLILETMMSKNENTVIYDLNLNADEERILSGFSQNFDAVKQNIVEKGLEGMKQYLITLNMIPSMR